MGSLRKVSRVYTPPHQIVLTGCDVEWSESGFAVQREPAHPASCTCGCHRRTHGRHQHGRDDCPNGCASRDLRQEAEDDMYIVCARCLTATGDPPGWTIATAVALMLAKIRDEKRAEKERSLALRRFGAAERKRKGEARRG